VDWEIKATLDKEHALIGVNLPTNPIQPGDWTHKPDRLQDNINSGYAMWTTWAIPMSNPSLLPGLIEQARSRRTSLIRNSRELRRRNGY
jgi:hypothetical protein